MILMINDRFYNEQEIRQLIQSQAEQIRQLKKMLLQALADFETISIHECAHIHSDESCTDCPLNNVINCKWIYEPEALELIGGSEND